jgi:hypothetical protein
MHQRAEKYLTPDKMVIVVAGGRYKIENSLRKLGIGPTEAQDAEGHAMVEKTVGAPEK